jgi:hypothetical protein
LDLPCGVGCSTDALVADLPGCSTGRIAGHACSRTDSPRSRTGATDARPDDSSADIAGSTSRAADSDSADAYLCRRDAAREHHGQRGDDSQSLDSHVPDSLKVERILTCLPDTSAKTDSIRDACPGCDSYESL